MNKTIHRGLTYERFHVGQVLAHHWGRTFGESDLFSFSNMTMQHNPLYFNREYAKSIGYTDIPVHPMLVFSTALGLSVEDLSEAGGPFLGVDDLVFERPVYAGDTLNATSTVLAMRTSESRPGWGIVEWRTTAVNQRGEEVVTFRRRNLSRVGPGARMSSEAAA